MQYVRQCTRADVAAGWATIDAGFAERHGFGVRPAARVTALSALRLRQDAVDAFDEIDTHGVVVLSAAEQ